jgi:REP element-mobilizing transposase RayT
MTNHIIRQHNKSLLLYHVVCPIKYRRKVITEPVEQTLREICQDIAERYEMHFVEIGLEEDHVHFLIQSVPMLSPKRMVQVLKSITAREIFHRHPEVKKYLWGGQFWTEGYYINTVGPYTNQQVIAQYIRNQGKQGQYKQIHRSQLSLFEGLA